MAGMACAVCVFLVITTTIFLDIAGSSTTQTAKGGQVGLYVNGPHGLPGRDGLSGRDGLQGNPGIPGIPGRQGMKGAKGDVGMGLKGYPGSPGSPGKDGPRGEKGGAGVKGATGAPGRAARAGPGISGITYVQWGRKHCSASGVQTLYSGVAAGSSYGHSGGGANTQCLPLDPVWASYKSGSQGGGYIYGTEYQVSGGGIQPFLNKGLHDHEVPCALCYAPNKNTQFMLPAKNICPTGWSKEYHGYLMAAYYSHQGRNMYVCVDHNAEPTGSSSNHNGNLFYPVEAQCGSLPCPPYVGGRELTCAVCTK